MKRTVTFLFSIALGLLSCQSQRDLGNTNLSLSDKKATTETIVLYQKLNKLTAKGFLFGHQDDLAYGVNWKYETGKSDVKDVVGDYPAVYGWDIAGIENDKPNNIDGVPFDKMKQYIKESHDRGGITTISMHFDNPLTGKNAWDTTPNSLASVLPNGVSHEKYTKWLDKTADFLMALKDKKGKQIPVLFRPYHELTGTWFWWCKNNATPQEFTTLWKFTFDYLQKKGVHNLIYVYNTADFKSKEDFLEYYPGDDYVDIISFDKYQYTDPTKDDSFIVDCQKQFKIMNEIAQEKHKLMAFAETGYEQIPYSKWWTNTLIKAIGDYKISYVLVWRNHGWQEQEKKMHYYAPYPGQISAPDFIEFYKLKSTLFEKDIK